jgi:hypothetical protein
MAVDPGSVASSHSDLRLVMLQKHRHDRDRGIEHLHEGRHHDNSGDDPGRGCATRISLRARSGRSMVYVKKKRNAGTTLFMVGVGPPASRCSIWNRRTSSAVAVSGERPKNLAKRPTSRSSTRPSHLLPRPRMTSLEKWCRSCERRLRAQSRYRPARWNDCFRDRRPCSPITSPTCGTDFHYAERDGLFREPGLLDERAHGTGRDPLPLDAPVQIPLAEDKVRQLRGADRDGQPLAHGCGPTMLPGGTPARLWVAWYSAASASRSGRRHAMDQSC